MIALPSAKNSHSAKIGEGLRLRLGKGTDRSEKEIYERSNNRVPGIKGCEIPGKRSCFGLRCVTSYDVTAGEAAAAATPRAEIVIRLPRLRLLLRPHPDPDPCRVHSKLRAEVKCKQRRSKGLS